ncbi:MAG: DUF547 domain-containing protein [Bacteroidetes bacterium]|nr:DUF547 domain-containing protein [Bacteroidota bacterium]
MRNIIFIQLFTLLLLGTSCQGSPAPSATENNTATTALPAEDNAPVAVPTEETTANGEALATNQPTTRVADNPLPASPKKAAAPVEKPSEKVAVRENPSPTPTAGKSAETKPVEATQPPIAEQPKPQPVEEEKAAAPPSHDAWDKLLQQYVNAEGKVNYDGLKKDKAKLEAYLKTLESNPPQDGWSRGEKMAFWINAYNASTVKLIVDNYPLASITKLDGGKTWDVKRVKIGGKTYSLNNIENDILRPQFKDARIHFAVNCAALGCPPLLNRAWTAANLESNLEKQALAFVNNPRFNKISEKTVQVSKIFEWYAADFGNVTGFLNKYATKKIGSGAKLTYLEYDWGLNKQ